MRCRALQACHPAPKQMPVSFLGNLAVRSVDSEFGSPPGWLPGLLLAAVWTFRRRTSLYNANLASRKRAFPGTASKPRRSHRLPFPQGALERLFCRGERTRHQERRGRRGQRLAPAVFIGNGNPSPESPGRLARTSLAEEQMQEKWGFPRRGSACQPPPCRGTHWPAPCLRLPSIGGSPRQMPAPV